MTGDAAALRPSRLLPRLDWLRPLRYVVSLAVLPVGRVHALRRPRDAGRAVAAIRAAAASIRHGDTHAGTAAAAASRAVAQIAARDWYERTPAPAVAVQELSAPRVCARRLTVTEQIRRAYELADAPVAQLLAGLGWQC